MMKPPKKFAIALNRVSKKHSIHHHKPTLVEKIFKGSSREFFAINNLSLTIKKGEKVGIIGPNGSGKTTLLKIIAGITAPTTGQVQTDGKIVSLIDLEAGFHPDLTGEQNIFINGMLLGMSRREIFAQLDKIISFAKIGEFINTPLFTYSSGMKLKLGFSIAAHANPDILILDESIYAGDIEFQSRLENKLREFIAQNKTIIIVTHWLEFVRDNCQRVIIMDKGKIKNDGTARKMIQQYIARYGEQS